MVKLRPGGEPYNRKTLSKVKRSVGKPQVGGQGAPGGGHRGDCGGPGGA